MIIVYFDASLTSPERVGQGSVTRALTVVTSCVASLDAWTNFECSWKRYLDEVNLNRKWLKLAAIPYVRRSKLEGESKLSEQEQSWRASWKRPLMEKMADLMTIHVPYVVSLGVNPAVWSEACERNDYLNTHTPFSFCVLQCLHEIGLWADREDRTDSRVYIVEDGDGQDNFLDGIRTHVLHAPKIKARFRWHGMYLMAKTGATRTFDGAGGQSEINLPVHPLELSDSIAWEHRRMSERGDLRHSIDTEDTPLLIWTLQQQSAHRSLVANYDLETLATLEPDPDGMVLSQ